MKKFLYKLLIFTLIIFTIFFWCFLINNNIIKWQDISMSAKQDTIILWSSMMRRWVDTKYIPRWINLAATAELPSEYFLKLKQLLQHSEYASQVKYVIAWASYQDLSVWREWKRYSFGPSIKQVCDRYATIAPDKYFRRFIKYPHNRFIHCYLKSNLLINSHVINYLKWNDISLFGKWYVWLPNKKRSELYFKKNAKTKIRRNLWLKEVDTSIYAKPLLNTDISQTDKVSQDQINDIKEMALYLQEKWITLIVINPPITKEYKRIVPKVYKDAMNKLWQELNAMNDIKYYDRTRLFWEVWESWNLHDTYHATENWAQAIAKKINSSLKTIEKNRKKILN